MKLLFPAHAGVILWGDDMATTVLAFPRACGGDPWGRLIGYTWGDFSPRMRG